MLRWQAQIVKVILSKLDLYHRPVSRPHDTLHRHNPCQINLKTFSERKRLAVRDSEGQTDLVFRLSRVTALGTDSHDRRLHS
jgi:hypothetical protein